MINLDLAVRVKKRKKGKKNARNAGLNSIESNDCRNKYTINLGWPGFLSTQIERTSAEPFDDRSLLRNFLFIPSFQVFPSNNLQSWLLTLNRENTWDTVFSFNRPLRQSFGHRFRLSNRGWRSLNYVTCLLGFEAEWIRRGMNRCGT